jgi:hypothetical protein
MQHFARPNRYSPQKNTLSLQIDLSTALQSVHTMKITWTAIAIHRNNNKKNNNNGRSHHAETDVDDQTA